MCGILGSFPASKLRLDFLRHRGPDGSGAVALPEIALGHTRLAILELTERAAQPKWSTDGNVLLTYNGEIYNYSSLGLPEEHSDTVALAEWLAREGPAFDPAKLDGMYAFAAYFVRERRLVLCRDPVGIKPLYIALSEDGALLAFASEIKGFFGVDWFRPRPNLDAEVQRDFLQYGYGLPRPVQILFRGQTATLQLVPSLLAGVYQVCPGQVLTFSPDEKAKEDWTRLPRKNADILTSLTESVREQSMSDVEVGVQLSGGIDSSLVAYEYARNNPAVHGFFVRVDYPGHSEAEWAAAAGNVLSKTCRFQFHEIVANEAQVRRALPSVIWYMDEPPIRHPNALGVYLLCEYVRQNTQVEVLLTGEGADELFGGYSWHDARTVRAYDRSRRIFDVGGSPLLNRLAPPQVQGFPVCLLPSHRRANAARILEWQLLYDRTIYLPPILLRQDRMSMAHAIEARVPFLSNRFLQMPAPAVAGKKCLKDRAAQVFGTRFAKRAKIGFGFPLPWLGGLPIRQDALDWLRESWKPTTDFHRWALTALSQWALYYLHDGCATSLRPRRLAPERGEPRRTQEIRGRLSRSPPSASNPAPGYTLASRSSIMASCGHRWPGCQARFESQCPSHA